MIRGLRAPPWTDASTPWKEANEEAGALIGGTAGAPGAPSQGEDGQGGGIPDRGIPDGGIKDGGVCDGGMQDRGMQDRGMQDGQEGGCPSTSPTPADGGSADGGSPSTSASATPSPSHPPPPPPSHPPPPDGGSASTSATAPPSHPPPPTPPRRDSGQRRSDTHAHAASPSTSSRLTTSCKTEAGRETTHETTPQTTPQTTHEPSGQGRTRELSGQEGTRTEEASRREEAEGREKTSEREKTHDYQPSGQGQEMTHQPLAQVHAPQTRCQREVEICEELGKEGDKTGSNRSNSEFNAVSVKTEFNAVSKTEFNTALKTELETFVPRVRRVVKRWPWEEELGVVRARPSVVTWYVSERQDTVSHVPEHVSVSHVGSCVCLSCRSYLQLCLSLCLLCAELESARTRGEAVDSDGVSRCLRTRERVSEGVSRCLRECRDSLSCSQAR